MKYGPESDQADLKPVTPDKRPAGKTSTGNPGLDGYTALDRRARGDIPGEIQDRDAAEAEEKRYEDMAQWGWLSW